MFFFHTYRSLKLPSQPSIKNKDNIPTQNIIFKKQAISLHLQISFFRNPVATLRIMKDKIVEHNHTVKYVEFEK